MALTRSPKQLRAQRTRRELLGGARLVFGRQGYQGATVEDIAQAAGCSKGAYYFHFASKEETLLALLDAWISDRTQRLAQAAAVANARVPALAKALSWQEGGWEPELLVEFWAQAQRNGRVGERLGVAYTGWHSTIAEMLTRTGEGDVAPPGAPLRTSAGVMLAIADGFALQSWLRVAPPRWALAQQMATAFELVARRAALRRAG